jgi:hypothetical protein
LFGSLLEAAGGGSITVGSATGEHLQRFALPCGVQSFMDLFILDKVTKLRLITSLIVLDSWQRIDAASRPSSSLLRHVSTIVCFFAMH